MKSTRRTFLKKTLVGTASLGIATTLPGSMVARHAVPAGEKFIVGLIGCKNMGYTNLKDFLKHPGVECAALCDVDDEYLNNRADDVEKTSGKKPKLYKDFRKLLENRDVDAVIIGTPDHWHCLHMVYACQAGKDVYVEKPLANTIEECDILVRAARRYNRIVQVGQQQRSGKHWQEAIRFVQSDQLGKIRRVNIWANFDYGAGKEVVPDEPVPIGLDYDMWLGPAPLRSFNRNRFHGYWRMFWDYGGGLMTDWGVHLIDMALWAMKVSGPPRSTSAVGGQFDCANKAIETGETQSVLYEFDDFIMVWEQNGGIQIGPWGRNYGVAFVGTNGTLIADRENWEVIAQSDEDKNRMEPVPPQMSDHASHMNHVKDFIECVKSRKKPACDVEIGRDAAFYAHLGNIAYRTGHKIVWDAAENAFINDSQADALVRANYRKPWEVPKI